MPTKYVVHKRAVKKPNGTLCGSEGFRIYLSDLVTCAECLREIRRPQVHPAPG